jgi:hypothetical protein
VNNHNDDDLDLGSSPVERVVHRLLRRHGELLPETAEDVAASEASLKREALPPGLRDPSSVFTRKVKFSLPPAAPPATGVDLGVVEGFRAAARGGSGISEDLEKKLSADWDVEVNRKEDEDRKR